MASRDELSFRITAEDDASKVLDKVVDKVDELEGDKVEVEIEADTRTAQQKLDQFFDKVEGLDQETATVVLAVKAAEAQNDLAQLLAEIGRLDAADPTIDVKIEQANALKTELDQIKTKIEDVNATPLDVNTAPAVDGLHKVGVEGDQSRSVLANMVGNASQDLGELGGIAGTAGVALGQLGEYAADGTISLSGLAKVAGPMAALTVVTIGLQKAQKDQAKAAKESKEALEDLASVADDAVWGTFLQALVKGKFAGEDLDETIQNLTDTNLAAAKRTLEVAEATGKTGEITDKLRKSIEEKEQANAQAATTEKRYGEAVEDSADAMGDASDAADILKTRQERIEASAQRAADAQKALADALNEQITAMEGAADSAIAAEDAQKRFAEAAGETTQAQKEHGKTSKEYADAVDNERDALIDAAKAARDHATDLAEADGTTLSATEKIDNFNQSLLDNARVATPAARRAAYEYLIQLNDIPEETATRILALIDEGKVDEAEAMLNNASRTRSAAINADAHTEQAEADLAELTRKKYTAQITAVLTNAEEIRAKMSNPFRPSGNSVAGTSITTVNVNLPRGARHTDIARALNTATRRNGRRFGSMGIVQYAKR